MSVHLELSLSQCTFDKYEAWRSHVVGVRHGGTLFRKDGQQHEDLTHAINQTFDWLRYIQDNSDAVQRELGLSGISPHPQCVIVIGRSASLTEQDRRKLTTLQGATPRLRILTYDDLLVAATHSIVNLLGPLVDTDGTTEIYFRMSNGGSGRGRKPAHS